MSRSEGDSRLLALTIPLTPRHLMIAEDHGDSTGAVRVSRSEGDSRLLALTIPLTPRHLMIAEDHGDSTGAV